MSKIELTIIQAMKQSGKTAYIVAKETGVDKAVLSRFLNSKSRISIATADILCDYFGLRLIRG